jgi:hypothetical protein
VKRGVVLPAPQQRLSAVVDQRHASFFLFFLAKADKAEE